MKERLFIKRAKEKVAIEEFLRSEFKDAKVGEIEVGYTPLGARIVIHTVSPGLVIGSGGEKIREISAKLKDKFGLENPQIDVQKISSPDLDPHIVAQSIATAVERNVNVKKVGNFYVDRIMAAGAVGCEIVIKGKLGGEKARKERFIAGYLKKCGDPAKKDVVTGGATACPKLGDIGVMVRIMFQHSDKKIEVAAPAPGEQGSAAAAPGVAGAAEEVAAEPAVQGAGAKEK